MKISTLSVIFATLLTLTLSTPVLGASARHRKCPMRPQRHGPPSGSVIVHTMMPSPTHPIPRETHSNPPSSFPQTTAPAPAPAGPPSPQSGGPTSSELAYLDPQNSIRLRKGADAFTWNSTLAAYAQQVANTCIFKHSGGPYGENLSAGTHPFTPAAAIALWTNEESVYDANDPVPSHYTQVVWKGSKQVGCAVTTCATLVRAFDVSVFVGLIYFYVWRQCLWKFDIEC
jgi:uncharacterized protein YkwD